jgi:hypothetical protein
LTDGVKVEGGIGEVDEADGEGEGKQTGKEEAMEEEITLGGEWQGGSLGR